MTVFFTDVLMYGIQDIETRLYDLITKCTYVTLSANARHFSNNIFINNQIS